MSVKHPQFIVAVLDQHIRNFYPDITTLRHSILIDSSASIIIGQRNRLEDDESVRQLLPYLVLYSVGENGEKIYHTYRRTKAVGESRLAGNYSVGYGGHIDIADVLYDEKSVIDLEATVANAANRELKEEITFVSDADGHTLVTELTSLDIDMLIAQRDLRGEDGSIPVGNVHLALVVLMEVPRGYHVKTNEDELARGEPGTAQELLASDKPLEDWTRIVLQNEAEIFKTKKERLEGLAIATDEGVVGNEPFPVIYPGMSVKMTNEENPLFVDPENPPENLATKTVGDKSWIYDGENGFWTPLDVYNQRRSAEEANKEVVALLDSAAVLENGSHEISLRSPYGNAADWLQAPNEVTIDDIRKEGRVVIPFEEELGYVSVLTEYCAYHEPTRTLLQRAGQNWVSRSIEHDPEALSLYEAWKQNLAQ